MSNKEYNKEIYDLLEAKNWSQLSVQEKEYVKHVLGENEYNNMHQTLLSLQNETNEEIPEIGPLVIQKKRKAFIQQFFQLKMPVYQAASILLTVMLFSYFSDFSKQPTTSKNNAQFNISAEYSKSMKEDSLAGIFITGIYR